ncbi:MAG: NTP transferase domain-containing protein [Turicibacter sp.]|nr:NTP transferase domain-containing protein [Turicibacter sp.]
MQRVKNAIIQAAGLGSRCVPLTYETPKALLTVKGEVLIERTIEQLLARDIREIIVIVNYKSEMFEYLVEKYGVILVRNPEALYKNTLSSIYFALDYLGSSYVLHGDNYFHENLFNSHEEDDFSWMSCAYMNGKSEDEWFVKLSEKDKNRIERVEIGGGDGFFIVGPVYFSPKFSEKLKPLIREYYAKPDTEEYYLADVLVRHLNELPIHFRNDTGKVDDIDDLQKFREIDPAYNGDAGNRILKNIHAAVGDVAGISNIRPIKTSITNKSFYFEIAGVGYVYRVARPFSDEVLNRKREHDIYKMLENDNITDKLVWFDELSGDKISVFLHGVRHCDYGNRDDAERAVKMLKRVHSLNYSIDYVFDLFEQIKLYEEPMQGIQYFSDYESVRENVLSLQKYFDSFEKEYTLCHIDLSNFNFLFVDTEDEQKTYFIDWEYGAMHEPHLDIVAMAIFANFNREKIDWMAAVYFAPEKPSPLDMAKIYGYMAILGFLWYLWYEYECSLGSPYRQYADVRYNYARDFYEIFMKTLERVE